jgi:hypothetical protein
MQPRRLQLIEVLDEVLRLLPKQHYYIPKFEDHKFEYVPDIRRKLRVDAKGLKTRRSSHAGKKSPWVDIPPLALTEKED